MKKSFKSEIVDTVIATIEEQMHTEKKHLMKTNTVFSRCSIHIDLTDDSPEREELLEIGMKQVIQSRLYSYGYFSVTTGYFVNIAECDNLWYLKLIIDGKDTTIESKVEARNRIKELKGLAGQMQFVPDEDGVLAWHETKTTEDLIDDLEADAV